MEYKLIDAEMDAVVDEWPATWRKSINSEAVSDREVGPPPDTPIDQAPL